MENKKEKNKSIIEKKEDIMRNEKGNKGGLKVDNYFISRMPEPEKFIEGMKAELEKIRPVYIKERARLEKRLVKLEEKRDSLDFILNRGKGVKVDLEALFKARASVERMEDRIVLLDKEFETYKLEGTQYIFTGVRGGKYGVLENLKYKYYKKQG